jgi:uncharacterized protein
MEMNVSQLLMESTGSTREYQIDESLAIDDSGKERPIKGKVKLVRIKRSILTQCEVNTETELICSRCLTSFRYPLKLKFQEEYHPIIDVSSGTPVDLPDDAGPFTIDEYHTLDLTEAIRQYTFMATPMKPLCRQECPGICQTCGKNLNVEKCSCEAQKIDPRWSQLTKLLEQ